MSETKPVTKRRMRDAIDANPHRQIVLSCQCEEFSANPSDYWQYADGDPFDDCPTCGEPFQLGYTRAEWVPV